MLFDDTYKTVLQPVEGVFRDKGSKFIAYLYPVGSENEIKEILNNLKALHPKAQHYCWALRLTQDRMVFRVSDDGEPSGTAGKPILNSLIFFEVTNLVAVVVRYFGGTLLGVPGLINAYKAATLEALGKACIIEQTINSVYKINFDYLQMNEVMKVIKDEELITYNHEFDIRCSLETEIRQSAINTITNKLIRIEGLSLDFIKFC
jgi:uncharacterized YigZ family protein